MIRDLMARGFKIIIWKLKLLSLKIRHGNRVRIQWSDRIAWSVKIRINGHGKIVFGENVELRENVIINVSDGGSIEIGDRVFFNDGCMVNVRKKIVIGADAMFGQCVKLYDHDYRSKNFKTDFKYGEIIISKSTWVCSDSIILKNSRVGEKAVIAAGTVVRGSVKPNMLYFTKKEYDSRSIDISDTEKMKSCF